jgi:hypothetical protein
MIDQMWPQEHASGSAFAPNVGVLRFCMTRSGRLRRRMIPNAPSRARHRVWRWTSEERAGSTVIFTLFLCALSVAGAILMILELYKPFHGLIHISSAPMRSAFEQLGK